MQAVGNAIQSHTQTTRLPTAELARQLVHHLGPTLVAVIANIRDRKLPHKWAIDNGPTPRHESLARLQLAHRAWVIVATAEGENTARSWFIGANPRLDETTPSMAIREGRFQAVIAAATAFVDGTDN